MATQRQKDRKKRTLERLKQVLATGKKPVRVENKKRSKGYSTSTTQTTAHTEQDKTRIGKEIHNLEKKLGLAA